MTDTIRVTLLVEGNEDGYYRDAQEMGEHVKRWIDGALWDRDDLTAWSFQVETEED